MNDKTVKKAPKWGTLEWIMAYPYSKMDRKRRKRAEAAIDPKELKALQEGPHTCCLSERMREVARIAQVKLAKKDMKRLVDALSTVAAFENVIYDCAFADLLGKAWKVDATGLSFDGRKGFYK